MTENHFQKDLGGFWASKFTLKTENAQFLRTLHQVLLKDIEKSSQYVSSGVCLFVCIGPGYCIQCGSSNPLGFIGFSLKPKVLGVCNAPSTNGSYGYIGIGGGNLLTLPTPVVKPNTTPAVI